MARIGARDTKPELLVRRGLHARGFRYRLHVRGLPGRPDIVFPKYRALVFVHGCFWHGHDCSLFRLPATRSEFWSAKIASNRRRDDEVLTGLEAAGWRALVVWECGLRGTGRIGLAEVLDRCEAWLGSSAGRGEIRGA